MVGYEDSVRRRARRLPPGASYAVRIAGMGPALLRWVKPVCYRNIEVRGCGAHELCLSSC